MNIKIYPFSLLGFLTLLLSSASAQIGLKGGPAISDIAFRKDGQTPYLGYEINSLEHRKPMPTFQVGAFSTFRLGKRFDFQPELLFAIQGLNYNTEYLYDDLTFKIHINYLEMPLLIRYKPFIRVKRQSALFAGPYSSWKISAVKITEIGGIREKSPMPNVKDVDFGVVAGYSIDFNLPSGQMIVDLRSCFSLMNMMDEIEKHIPWYYGPSQEYARNVSISLTVGYRFLNVWTKKQDNNE